MGLEPMTSALQMDASKHPLVHSHEYKHRALTNWANRAGGEGGVRTHEVMHNGS